MTRIHERIETALPLVAAFDYVADFANSQDWDPGTASSDRLDDRPVGPGSRYALEVRMGGRVAPMQYRIRDFDRPHRVVLVGSGPASTPLTTSASSASVTARSSSTPRTSACAACCGSSSRSWAGHSGRSDATPQPGWTRRSLTSRPGAMR